MHVLDSSGKVVIGQVEDTDEELGFGHLDVLFELGDVCPVREEEGVHVPRLRPVEVEGNLLHVLAQVCENLLVGVIAHLTGSGREEGIDGLLDDSPLEATRHLGDNAAHMLKIGIGGCQVVSSSKRVSDFIVGLLHSTRLLRGGNHSILDIQLYSESCASRQIKSPWGFGVLGFWGFGG